MLSIIFVPRSHTKSFVCLVKPFTPSLRFCHLSLTVLAKFTAVFLISLAVSLTLFPKFVATSDTLVLMLLSVSETFLPIPSILDTTLKLLTFSIVSLAISCTLSNAALVAVSTVVSILVAVNLLSNLTATFTLVLLLLLFLFIDNLCVSIIFFDLISSSL